MMDMPTKSEPEWTGERFVPGSGLILVRVRLFGPAGRALIPMALDTGATRTMINVAHPPNVSK